MKRLLPTLLVLASFLTAFAQDESVDDLIQSLEAESFTERAAAAAKLEALGADAVVPLVGALESPDAEVKATSRKLLSKALESEDKETAKATRDTIQRLSAEKPELRKLLSRQQLAFPNNGIQPRIQRAQAQAFAGAGAAGKKGMTVRSLNINGEKIRIETNDEKIKIQTTDRDGTTKVVEAESKEQLKKLDPDSFELFEKFGGNNMARLNIPQLQAAPKPLLQAQPLLQQFGKAPARRNAFGPERREAMNLARDVMTGVMRGSEKDDLLKQIEELKEAVEGLE